MILEEETFEKFRYYPSELSHGSHKKIIVSCTSCGEIRATQKRAYHDLCTACANKGKKNPNWKGGKIKCICIVCKKVFSIESFLIKKGRGKFCSRKCMGIANQGKNCFRWDGGLIQCKCRVCGKKIEVSKSKIKNGRGKYCSCSCSAKARRHKTKPLKTKPESIFENICKKHNLPFRFVGDGSLWLGNANPDFIHNTHKVVVEIFGDYWHSPLLNGNIRYTGTLEGRRNQLKREGYKLIVLWESDLKRKDAEAFILYTLAKYKIYPSSS